jgi:hypothetical protein
VFVVERAEDATRFVRIGEVAAAGNSSKALAYQFDDKNAAQIFNGKHVYYRLKMIDRDGSFEYSPARRVDFTNEAAEVIAIYPNPFKESTTIFFSSQFDESVKVQLFSNQGKLIGDIFDDQVAKGETYRFELDGTVMKPGVYYYTIASKSRVVHQKIEVIK